MYRVDSDNYIEEIEKPEPKVKIQRYSVTMIFSDVENGITIDGTVKFEMDIEIPSNPDDLELCAERGAFLRIENSETGYGHREKPLVNLEIQTLDKLKENEMGTELDTERAEYEDEHGLDSWCAIQLSDLMHLIAEHDVEPDDAAADMFLRRLQHQSVSFAADMIAIAMTTGREITIQTTTNRTYTYTY